MTPQFLKDIFYFVHFNNDLELVSYTALGLGFYLFLRKRNLVPDSVNTIDPQQELVRSAIFLMEICCLLV